jgi:hypothetical protein
MKCRFVMGPAKSKEESPAGSDPLSGPAPLDDRQPVREEPTLGAGAADVPPSWADKPELIGPEADLDDVFAGKGKDLGGYDMGGGTSSGQPDGPAVSDAFAIMTGSAIHTGSDEIPQRSGKGGKGRSKGRPKAPKAKREAPERQMRGELDGLPPDLGQAFTPGHTQDHYRPPSHIQGVPKTKNTRSAERHPDHDAMKISPEGDQDFAPLGPPPMQQPMRAPEPARPMAPPPQMAPPPSLGPPPRQEPLPPLGPPPGQQAPVVKRPIPKAQPMPAAAPPRAPKAPRQPRSMPAIPKPDLSFLSNARKYVTPRSIVTVLAGILVLIAIVFLLVGGNYFSSNAQGALDKAQSALARVGSVHIQADILMQTEKAGTINTTVSADVSRDHDLHAAYAATSAAPAVEYITAGGRTFRKVEGKAWEVSSDAVNPNLTSAALFDGVSGARLIDKQTIDGVACDHISFESGPAFARSLFPGVDVTQATTVDVEIWVDPQQNYVKHVRIDASNLETQRLGKFNCHVEATYSGYGAPLDIKPPA